MPKILLAICLNVTFTSTSLLQMYSIAQFSALRRPSFYVLHWRRAVVIVCGHFYGIQDFATRRFADAVIDPGD